MLFLHAFAQVYCINIHFTWPCSSSIPIVSSSQRARCRGKSAQTGRLQCTKSKKRLTKWKCLRKRFRSFFLRYTSTRLQISSSGSSPVRSLPSFVPRLSQAENLTQCSYVINIFSRNGWWCRWTWRKHFKQQSASPLTASERRKKSTIFPLYAGAFIVFALIISPLARNKKLKM